MVREAVFARLALILDDVSGGAGLFPWVALLCRVDEVEARCVGVSAMFVLPVPEAAARL